MFNYLYIVHDKKATYFQENDHTKNSFVEDFLICLL